MTMDPALRSQLDAMLSKARRSLKAARRHFEEGDYDFSASRAYYSAFYAMEAALLSKGLTCSTHGGALTVFSEQFKKAGPCHAILV